MAVDASRDDSGRSRAAAVCRYRLERDTLKYTGDRSTRCSLPVAALCPHRRCRRDRHRARPGWIDPAIAGAYRRIPNAYLCPGLGFEDHPRRRAIPRLPSLYMRQLRARWDCFLDASGESLPCSGAVNMSATQTLTTTGGCAGAGMSRVCHCLRLLGINSVSAGYATVRWQLSSDGMAVSTDGMADSLTLPTFSCNLVAIDDGGECLIRAHRNGHPLDPN
jgi:hypothetical protein